MRTVNVKQITAKGRPVKVWSPAIERWMLNASLCQALLDATIATVPAG
jgi:L-asparagine transporter-like permease